MYKVQSIGEVKSKFKEPSNPHEMRKHESTIIIKPDFVDGLYKIEDNDFLQIVFLFHLSEGYKLKGKRCYGREKGVFASRSPMRPNSIGITTVELLERNGAELRVKGLDAVDGTPVIDIKPFSEKVDRPNDNENR